MIPSLTPVGHLPAGRFVAEVDEIETAFVLDPAFAGSATRARLWQGFLDYLTAWGIADAAVGGELLRGLWIGAASRHQC